MKIGPGSVPANGPDSPQPSYAFQRLGQSLKDGDMSGAKFAFVKLSQVVKGLPSRDGKPLEKPLSRLADALLTGHQEDIAKAFQSLKLTMTGPQAVQPPDAAPPAVVRPQTPGMGSALDIVV